MNSKSNAELLPCPVCGAQPMESSSGSYHEVTCYHKYGDPDDDIGGVWVTARCDTREQAIEAWNRRPSRLEAISEAEPVAWPKHRANVPYRREEGDKRRVVGFVISPGDESYGEYGLSEPLGWLDRMCSAHTPPAGHVVVPVEPTEEMMRAFWNSEGPDAARYRAMLAALPHNQGGANG